MLKRFSSRCVNQFFKTGSVRAVSSTSGFHPRRSVLYVPGNDKKKMQKAATLPADIVILDSEDGVAQNMKVECRQIIHDTLSTISFKQQVGVRINSIDSSFAKDDLKACLSSVYLPDAIMIPKIESADQVKWIKNEATNHMSSAGHAGKTLSVIGQIETARGMFGIRPILEEAAVDHNNLRFECFAFGSDDYLASIGAVRTKDAAELIFARQYFIMFVKGFGLQAIDMVDINFNDLNNLKKQSLQGAQMGFTGKQVIHPAQLDVVNKCFSPSNDQVAYATELLKAFHQHQRSGLGAFTFHGSMIDMPSVKQAQNVLLVAEMLS